MVTSLPLVCGNTTKFRMLMFVQCFYQKFWIHPPLGAEDWLQCSNHPLVICNDLSCGWTSTELTCGHTWITHYVRNRVKMTTAKSPSIQEGSRIYAILLQDLMKRGVCRHVVEML
jgi:hypothetical protein